MMHTQQITLYNEGKEFPYLIIDNFYSAEEELLAWAELEELTNHLSRDIEESGVATSRGTLDPLARKRFIWMDDYYSEDRDRSFILNNNYKTVFGDEVLSKYLGPSMHLLGSSNIDHTLLNYYEGENEYYKSHWDTASHTTVLLMFKQPRGFTGGDLHFEQPNETVECINNRMIIFPSFYLHEVTPIKSTTNNKGYGRYSIVNFIDEIRE